MLFTCEMCTQNVILSLIHYTITNCFNLLSPDLWNTTNNNFPCHQPGSMISRHLISFIYFLRLENAPRVFDSTPVKCVFRVFRESLIALRSRKKNNLCNIRMLPSTELRFCGANLLRFPGLLSLWLYILSRI